MHPALCHHNKKIESAARQARGAMLALGRIKGVRTIEELATMLLQELDYPDKLGSDDQRHGILVSALNQLHEGKLISVHYKTAKALVTTKGRHASSGKRYPHKNKGRQPTRRFSTA